MLTPCTTHADASRHVPTTNHPSKMRGLIMTTGLPKNRNQWQKTIKRRVRANDLDALHLLLKIKCMDKWNRDLEQENS